VIRERQKKNLGTHTFTGFLKRKTFIDEPVAEFLAASKNIETPCVYRGFRFQRRKRETLYSYFINLMY
jgi:hypothetical protein